jgi:sugar phosphate isomerase/epimerase
MSLISRRTFLHDTTAGAAGAALLAATGRPLRAYPLGMPIGSQTYPHRQMVVDGNFPGLCKMMADIGVQSLELCSPGYKEFSSLRDGKMTRKILDDHGLICPSAHFTLGSLRDAKQQAEMIQWAKDLGMTQMAVATLSGGGRGAKVTMDVVKAAADEYNRIAAVAAKAGLQQALHNEGFEATMLDNGRRVYDVLFELLDPKLVKFQFQMSSARGLGIDPITFFRKHKGRFISLHLQGVPGIAPRAAGPGAAAPGAPTAPAAPASTATPAPPTTAAPAAGAPAAGGAPAARGEGGARRGGGGGGGGRGGLSVGRDSLNWAEVFRAARDGGIRNYFVEQSWELTQESVAFLKLLSA